MFFSYFQNLIIFFNLDEEKKAIISKAFLGFLSSLIGVFLSITYKRSAGIPEPTLGNPIPWFRPNDYPEISILIISLFITMITCVFQFELNTRFYVITSFLNGFSFEQTFKTFLIIHGETNVVQMRENNLITLKETDLYQSIDFSQLFTINNDEFLIYIANMITLIGIVSALISIIVFILRNKLIAKRKRLRYVARKWREIALKNNIREEDIDSIFREIKKNDLLK